MPVPLEVCPLSVKLTSPETPLQASVLPDMVPAVGLATTVRVDTVVYIGSSEQVAEVILQR